MPWCLPSMRFSANGSLWSSVAWQKTQIESSSTMIRDEPAIGQTLRQAASWACRTAQGEAPQV